MYIHSYSFCQAPASSNVGSLLYLFSVGRDSSPLALKFVILPFLVLDNHRCDVCVRAALSDSALQRRPFAIHSAMNRN